METMSDAVWFACFIVRAGRKSNRLVQRQTAPSGILRRGGRVDFQFDFSRRAVGEQMSIKINAIGHEIRWIFAVERAHEICCNLAQ